MYCFVVLCIVLLFYVLYCCFMYCLLLFYVLFVLYCSMYCLCVNAYCHRVTTQLPLTNISYHINTVTLKLRRTCSIHIIVAALGIEFHHQQL